MLRAYDGTKGDELWNWKLPADVHSISMGYRHHGKNYVIVTVGGNLGQGIGRGDHVIAFRLTKEIVTSGRRTERLRLVHVTLLVEHESINA